jgi:hypothetical protein
LWQVRQKVVRSHVVVADGVADNANPRQLVPLKAYPILHVKQLVAVVEQEAQLPVQAVQVPVVKEE